MIELRDEIAAHIAHVMSAEFGFSADYCVKLVTVIRRCAVRQIELPPPDQEVTVSAAAPSTSRRITQPAVMKRNPEVMQRVELRWIGRFDRSVSPAVSPAGDFHSRLSDHR